MSRRCNAGSSAISAVPVGLDRRITEHIGRHRAERVDDVRVELLSPPGTRHLHRSLDSLGAVEQLDGLGDMEQPHRQRDLLARDVTRHAPAVPAGERLLQLTAHVGAQAETLRHLGRGQAMSLQRALDRLAPGDDEARCEADPVQRGSTRPDVTQHQAQHGQPGQLDLEAVSAKGDVVAEPGRHLRCVRHATHPRQGGHVEQIAAVVELDAHVITQTGGDDPRSQDMLHGLTQPQSRWPARTRRPARPAGGPSLAHPLPLATA